MIGYRIDENKPIVTIIYNLDNLLSDIEGLTGDTALAIEVMSWAELASIGDVYEHDDFTVEIVEG